MATVFDVDNTTITDIDANVTNVNVASTTVVEVPQTGVPSTIQVITAGPQGAPGVQNVFVSPTPPSSPQVNWIWIDTS